MYSHYKSPKRKKLWTTWQPYRLCQTELLHFPCLRAFARDSLPMQKMFAKAQLTHPNKHTHIHTQSEESRRERLRHVYGLNRAEQTLATTAEFPTPSDHFQLSGIFRFSDLFPPFLTFPKRKRACF